MLLVKFSPGGRTRWHTHSFEQGLVIVDGRGIVASESQGERVVEAGDVVVFGTGEKHWHGATNTTGMSHVAVNLAGSAEILEDSEITTPGWSWKYRPSLCHGMERATSIWRPGSCGVW